MDLALKELLEFLGEVKEVVCIVAVIHWLKGDEQVDVA
jgi:hypothetical protein